MASGFSFRGTHISTLNMGYAPSPEDIFIWNTVFSAHDDTNDGFDGGHWHSSTAEPKKFSLRCYFEDATEMMITGMKALFARDAYGKLIFDDRIWMYYNARVVSAPSVKIYKTALGYSGEITLELRAYNPTGFMEDTLTGGYTSLGPGYENIAQVSALLPTAAMPQRLFNYTASPKTSQFSVLLLNAGDAPANTIIQLQGNASVIDIVNNTTKQTCRVVNMTDATTTDNSGYLNIDSRAGRTYLSAASFVESAEIYHDRGFITLAPAYTKIATMVNLDGQLINSPTGGLSGTEGKYIRVNGVWDKIVEVVSDTQVATAASRAAQNNVQAYITTLNEIVISPAPTMTLRRLNFIYQHTFQ